MANSAIAMPPAPTDFRWSREAFEELVEKDVFRPEDKIELLDGRLIKMAPQRSPHTTACCLCADYLRSAYSTGHVVRSQFPLALDRNSVPEPDLAVCEGSVRAFAERHPTEATLIVEVSDSSLGYDRGDKLAAYARAGIPEYWIINLVDRTLEVYREPDGERFRSARTFAGDERIAPLGREATTTSARDLLP